MLSSLQETVARVSSLIQESRSILFITGAGISADSGLPTYRGISGLYNDRTTEDGFAIEEALSGSMFRRRPEITWKYMAEIEAGARGKTFNRAHAVIAKIESSKPRVWVLTQNIDGFHGLAGSRNVIEIHGTMRRLRCTACGALRKIHSYENVTIPPICEACTGLMRPDIVLFEEALPAAAIAELDRQLRQPFDLYVSVGTSSVFPYVVEPLILANRMGLPTIEINPAEETTISKLVDVHLQLGAADAFQQITSCIGIE